jgi:glutamate synthase (NADPH/NADH) small chain
MASGARRWTPAQDQQLPRVHRSRLSGPCEGSCTLGINEPPVTIKNIECSIIDKGWRKDGSWPPPKRAPARRWPWSVPARPALACADQLNKAGHRVTVYERADRIGGLLMYGIPNMKLDKAVVQRRIDLMAAEGVEFITNIEIGVDMPTAKLTRENDAVVLCGGATKPRDLPVEGRELKGVHFAMDFLRDNTKYLLDAQGRLSDQAQSAEGLDVIVIGGGDTGTDCVGTSLRQGCNSVIQFEILPEPPLERQPDNPWPEWPKVLRVDYGQEEAIALQGEDPRNYLIMTKKMVGDENGHVKELHTVEIEWVFPEERRTSLPEGDSWYEKVWPAQLVLLAMGFLGPEETMAEQLGLELDPRSNFKAEHGEFATSVEGVFAAGDMRRGQSLVVWAINEGRGAARECDRYLMGETSLP